MKRNKNATSKNCLNCHFLGKQSSPSPVSLDAIPLETDERKELANNSFDSFFERQDRQYTRIGCTRKVWECSSFEDNENINRLKKALDEPRNDNCYYYPNLPKMSFAAAVELECRMANRREAEKDRGLTRRAFRVALIALIISIIATIANLTWDFWKYHHPRAESRATSQPTVSP